jgi:hypothetical protein
MEPVKNFQATVPSLLLQQVQQAAQANHITLDELATEALQQHLARHTLQRFRREAESRRGGMSDEEVERYVDKVIHEHRQEERDRQNSERGH